MITKNIEIVSVSFLGTGELMVKKRVDLLEDGNVVYSYNSYESMFPDEMEGVTESLRHAITFVSEKVKQKEIAEVKRKNPSSLSPSERRINTIPENPPGHRP